MKQTPVYLDEEIPKLQKRIAELEEALKHDDNIIDELDNDKQEQAMRIAELEEKIVELHEMLRQSFISEEETDKELDKTREALKLLKESNPEWP